MDGEDVRERKRGFDSSWLFTLHSTAILSYVVQLVDVRPFFFFLIKTIKKIMLKTHKIV